MKTDTPMSGIKGTFVSILKSCGYWVSTARNGSNIVASNTDRFNLEYTEIAFRIVAGTARKFDVYIEAEKEDFLVKFINKGPDRGLAFLRFNRTESGVMAALKWIGGALKSSKHLQRIIDPCDILPEPFRFADVVQDKEFSSRIVSHKLEVVHGAIKKVLIHNIITLDGIHISINTAKPDAEVWFLMEIEWSSNNHYSILIATDGDRWHPVHRIKDVYTIIESSSVGFVLNNNDLLLIKHAMSEYVNWLTENA